MDSLGTQQSSTHSEAQGVVQQHTHNLLLVRYCYPLHATSLVPGCLQHCLGEERTNVCVAVFCPSHLSHCPRSQHNQSTQRMEVQDDEWAGTVQHNTPTHTLHTSTTHCPPLHTHVPFSLPLYTISPPLLRHTPHTVSSSHLQGQTHNETIQQCCKYNNTPWRHEQTIIIKGTPKIKGVNYIQLTCKLLSTI